MIGRCSGNKYFAFEVKALKKFTEFLFHCLILKQEQPVSKMSWIEWIWENVAKNWKKKLLLFFSGVLFLAEGGRSEWKKGKKGTYNSKLVCDVRRRNKSNRSNSKCFRYCFIIRHSQTFTYSSLFVEIEDCCPFNNLEDLN